MYLFESSFCSFFFSKTISGIFASMVFRFPYILNHPLPRTNHAVCLKPNRTKLERRTLTRLTHDGKCNTYKTIGVNIGHIKRRGNDMKKQKHGKTNLEGLIKHEECMHIICMQKRKAIKK